MPFSTAMPNNNGQQEMCQLDKDRTTKGWVTPPGKGLSLKRGAGRGKGIMEQVVEERRQDYQLSFVTKQALEKLVNMFYVNDFPPFFVFSGQFIQKALGMAHVFCFSLGV